MRWLLPLLFAVPAAAQDGGVLESLYTLSEADGVQTCTPRGALAALMGEAPACGLDFMACERAPGLIRGEAVEPELVATLVALVGWDAGHWQAQCPGEGPHFVHQTGILGLAALGGQAPLDALLALTTPEALPVVGENVRRQLAEALTWLDDRAAAPALGRLAALATGNPDARPPALVGLGRWGDPAAVAVCTAGPEYAPLGATCLDYLAAVKAEGAFEAIEAGAAAHPEAAARALGRLGDARALPVLKRMAGAADLSVRLAAQVSLLELGDETFLGSLTAALQAPERLRQERMKRMKRQPKRVRRPTRTRKGRKVRVRPPAPPSAKATAALMKELAALDLATRVAMECGRLHAANERIDKALRSAAAAENEVRPQANTAALIALAQRGNLQAIQQVAGMLPTSVDPVRTLLLEGAGALYLEPWQPTTRRGLGVIAHRTVLEALTALADEAESHAQRALALRAALSVRLAMRPPP